MKIRHVAFEKRKRIQRTHHTEAIGGVGRILLEDMNLPSRKPAFDQQREEQPGRTSADDVNLHDGYL